MGEAVEQVAEAAPGPSTARHGSPNPVEVSLLGPVEARRDGVRLPVRGTPQRLLLARLALTPGRTVPVPDLVDLLWADHPPAGAVRNLRSYVSRLRRVLGGDLVCWGPGGYRLEVRPEDVDIGGMEHLATRAAALTDTDPARAADLLGDALGLWRGAPLEGLPERLALVPDLVRLTERRLQLTEQRLALLLDTGRGPEALPDLERATHEEPLRERLHLLLMRALHQAGRTADALAAGRSYRRLLAEETGLDPSPALAELEQGLRTGDPRWAGIARRAPARRRFAPTDRFVGRAAELTALRSALPPRRAVTVVGPGGIGKTRLVLELLDTIDIGPTFLAELADVPAGADAAVAVAARLGLLAAPSGAAAAIAERLATGPALLVLDNCEHLLAATHDLVTDLLARCPALRVLATSRRRLGVQGEQVMRLGPLPHADRTALFTDRAALLRHGFDGDRPEVSQICEMLDGLPLAVELAASREAVFGLRELRDRLAGGLQVLEPSPAGERGNALVATTEWSYRLLDPVARGLFDRLSITRGGFGSDAVEHLAPAQAANAPALLAELVEASMVLPDLSADPPRYRLLEPVRQVGAGHLTPEQLEAAHADHVRWLHAHLEGVRRRQDERSPEATAMLRRELGNLHAGLGRLIDTGRWADAADLAVPLAVALSDDVHLDLTALLRRLAEAHTGTAEIDARCAIAAGGACWLHGDVRTAEPLLTAALEGLPAGHPQRWSAHWFRAMSRMYRGDVAGVAADTSLLLADPAAPAWTTATAVCNLALIHLFTGAPEQAEQCLSERRELLDRLGAVDGFVAYTRGELAATRDPREALRWFERAYRQCARAGHVYNRDVAAVGRAAALIRTSRHREAVEACRDLIATLRATGMWPQLWTTLRLAAELLLDLDDPGPAAALLAAADADPLAPEVLGAEQVRHRDMWARIAGGLRAEAVDGARHDGSAIGRSAAADLADTALGRHLPSPTATP